MFKRLGAIGALVFALCQSGFAVEPPALEWDYEYTPRFVFQVWQSYDLEHWSLLATTQNHYLHIDPVRETFYICRVLDMSSGLWSDWSNRADFGLTLEQSQALDALIQNTE